MKGEFERFKTTNAFDGTAKNPVKQLESEVRLANELGFDAHLESSVPFLKSAGIRFPNQARFRPMEYLNGLIGISQKSVFDSTRTVRSRNSPSPHSG